jgi:hypothetical protein
MSLAAGVCLLLLLSGSAAAQTATVVPGERYRAGETKRRLLGSDYRDLWVTPVTVPVLDLRVFAGGLTPIRRGGGQQTTSLRLSGADGREYAFRSVAKEPGLARHPDVRGALLGDLVQDQASSMVPAASLAVTRLAAAAGLLTPLPELYVMPDDPALGEFREDFAGMLGTLEEHADEREGGGPGFAGLSRIVATDRMLEHLEENPTHGVDELAYLRARLFDLVIGDWDRHADQWRWGRMDHEGGTRWVPIPRDRDYAFADYDGALLGIARRAVPNAVRFRGSIDDVNGLVLNASELDRRLLAWVGRDAWEAAADSLRTRLTDEAISDALLAMPAEHRELRGPEIEATLRSRRDRIAKAATGFYLRTSRLVDLWSTDADEHALIRRNRDGSVDVSIRVAATDGASTPRTRTFLPSETREIRVHLRGGADRALVDGEAVRGIRVRILGGGGADVLEDASVVVGDGRWTSLHDAGEDDRLTGVRGTILDRREYAEPSTADPGLVRVPPPAEGERTEVLPIADYSTTRGAIVGLSVSRTTYAFRHHPHAARVLGELRYSPRFGGISARLSGQRQSSDPSYSTSGQVEVSWIDALRYYGFGNETELESPASRFVVRRDHLSAGASIHVDVGGGARLTAGPVLSVSRPRVDGDSQLALERPRGWDRWSSIGAAGRMDLDRTANIPFGGTLHAGLAASARKPVQGGERVYGDLLGRVALEIPVTRRSWLLGRVGGHRSWGGYPFHAAAFLGGPGSVRGLPEWRYAGDAMVHGTLEAGAPIGRLPLVLNWAAYGFAFVDGGRVFAAGDESDRWHAAPGAGLELRAFDLALRLTYAHGPAPRIYLATRSLRTP